jgi:hypothetical protein
MVITPPALHTILNIQLHIYFKVIAFGIDGQIFLESKTQVPEGYHMQVKTLIIRNNIN